MSSVSKKPFETTPATNDAKQPAPLIAWRSLSISILIAIVTTVLLYIGALHLHMRLYDAPQWQNDALNWVVVNLFGFPVLVGGVYLALKVRHRWLLQSGIYISLFLMMAAIPWIADGYQSGLYFLVRIAPCYLVISFVRWLVHKYLTRGNAPEARDEKLRFGFTTIFWTSTLVALLVSLMIWTFDSLKADSVNRRLAREEAMKVLKTKAKSAQLAIDGLVALGGVYDQVSKRITFRAKISTPRPVDAIFNLLIGELGEIGSVEFIDCEFTDETIAKLQEARANHKPFSVTFVNCTVITELNPSSGADMKKVKLGPLSGDLP